MAGKWKKEDIELIKEFLQAKRSIKFVAAHFNTTIDNIRMVMSRNNLKVNDYKKPDSRRPSNLELNYKNKQKSIAERLAYLQGQDIQVDVPPVEFTDEELLSWVNDFDKFCSECLSVSMQNYQLEMSDLANKNKRCVFVMGRGIGKDYWASAYVLYMAIIKANFKVLIVSGAQRQSDLLRRRIELLIASNDKLFASVSRSRQDEIYFKNNSMIVSLPSTAFIRGYQNVNLVIVNEAAFISSSREFVESVIMPMLGTSEGSLVLLSTPLASSDECIVYSAFNNPLFKRLHYPTSRNKYVTEEFLKEQKVLLSHQRFKQEYEAEFLDAVNCFFDSKVVDKVIKEYDFAMQREDGKRYSIGFDPARIRDSSVISVVSEDKAGFLKVEYIKEFKNTPFPQQEAFIKYLVEKFHPFVIVCEYAGLGIGSADHLEKDRIVRVEKFRPTVENKLKVYEFFKIKMEQGLITLPYHEKLIRELKCFEFRVTESGKVLLHHTSTGSDDFSDSVCFAVSAFKRQKFQFLVAGGRRRIL